MVGQTEDICSRCGICRQFCLVLKAGNASIASELTEASGLGAWNCINCWKCIESCPEGVDIYSYMMERRRLEDMPLPIRESVENIKTTGCALSVQGLDQLREMYGLSPLGLVDKETVRALLDPILRSGQ